MEAVELLQPFGTELWRLLFSSAWQGSLFALALLLVTLSVRRIPACVKHGLWLLVLLKLGLPLPLELPTAQWSPMQWVPEPVIDSAFAIDFPESYATGSFVFTAAPIASDPHENFQLPLTACFALLWVATTLGILAFRLARYRRVRKLMFRLGSPASDALIEMASTLHAVIGLRRRVVIFEVEELVSPMVLGFLRPIVFMPACESSNLTAGELRALLAHELQHLHRRDHWVLPLEMFVLALHWFNPIAWLAVRRLRAERERATDDAVMAMQGDIEADYGSGLLKLARATMAAPTSEAGALALFESRRELAARIKRLMIPRRITPKIGKLAFAAILALACIVLAKEPENADRSTLGAELGSSPVSETVNAAPPASAVSDHPQDDSNKSPGASNLDFEGALRTRFPEIKSCEAGNYFKTVEADQFTLSEHATVSFDPATKNKAVLDFYNRGKIISRLLNVQLIGGDADRIEFSAATRTITLSGHASWLLAMGESEVRSDKVDELFGEESIRSDEVDQLVVKLLDADKPFSIRNAMASLAGERIERSPDGKTATSTGKAKFWIGAHAFNGDRMEFDLQKQMVTVRGNFRVSVETAPGKHTEVVRGRDALLDMSRQNFLIQALDSEIDYYDLSTFPTGTLLLHGRPQSAGEKTADVTTDQTLKDLFGDRFETLKTDEFFNRPDGATELLGNVHLICDDFELSADKITINPDRTLKAEGNATMVQKQRDQKMTSHAEAIILTFGKGNSFGIKVYPGKGKPIRIEKTQNQSTPTAMYQPSGN